MAVRFWAAVAAFHLVVGSLAIFLARRHRARAALATRSWLGGLARDAAVFVAVAIVAGAVASSWAPMPGFTVLRLWCQALFGEGIFLGAWLTFVESRVSRGRAAALGCATLALLAVYVQAYHREPHQLHVRHHALRLAPVTHSARRLRILHLTDIQAATIGRHEERALRAGLAERPDMIVFTGDYIHERVGQPTGRKAAGDFRDLLRRVGLSAPLGVWATEGDTGYDCAGTFHGLAVRCVVDDCVDVPGPQGSRIAVAGLSSVLSRGRMPSRARAVVTSCPRADLSLVMAHRPDYVANLVDQGRVSLALAGHTHGGQVVLPLFGPPMTLSRLPRRFAGGLNDYEGIPLHVSRGVGMERGTAPQIRFLCPPEICLLDVYY